MPLARSYDEMYEDEDRKRPREHYRPFADWLAATSNETIAQNRQAADLLFHRLGITFAVYGEAAGRERLIPFDIIPHVIPADRWEQLSEYLATVVMRLPAWDAALAEVKGHRAQADGEVATAMDHFRAAAAGFKTAGQPIDERRCTTLAAAVTDTAIH